MKHRYTPKPRTTQRLTGTHAKVTAYLDFESLLAIEWIRRVLQPAGREAVHISGVIRRALQVYARHVEAGPRGEHRAIGRASGAREWPEDDQRMAELRLYVEPLPGFEVVRDGAGKVAERAALHQRIENELENLSA